MERLMRKLLRRPWVWPVVAIVAIAVAGQLGGAWLVVTLGVFGSGGVALGVGLVVVGRRATPR
jgi:hypothetical protein